MVRHASPRLASAAALTTVLALAAASAQADPSDFRPGAPGVGDTYYPGYGNGGYDVSRYRIDLTYHPTDNRIEAQTTIEAEATQDLSRFNLDLVGLTVRSIEVDGHAASWSRSGQELSVTPPHGLREGREFQTVVRYDGVPVEFVLPGTNVRTGFMATDDGATVAGQPEVAASWFPANDHPQDKAAYTFVVAVPDGQEVVANGVLQSRRSHQGWTTFTWRAAEPMAPYLATIDIGQWDVRTWKTDSGLPVYDAVDPDLVADPVLGPAIDASLKRQGEIVDVLADHFGPYPFHTVGAIVDDQDDLYFALETQTRPVYSRYFWPDGGDFVVAHELAHQWFGDDVALARWQDIWLNEGFATYAEWLWAEHEGLATPAEMAASVYDQIPAGDPFWALRIGDPGVAHLFDGPVYVRGAMALQALRAEVGEQDFWRIIRTWAHSRSGGTGTTPQLVALAERVSGTDLAPLFDAWLYTGAKPAAAAAVSGAARATFGTSATSAHAAAYARQWLIGLQQRAGIAQRGR